MNNVMTLYEWNLKNKRVILRADLNVPLSDGKVLSDYRLDAVKPTLDYLIKSEAQVIVLTHIGRPENHEKELSTKHLLPWFTGNNYDAQFAPTLEEAHKSTARITLLENLRFWPEERTPSEQFAHQLATLGEFYVNDAFGAMHRNDTSITLLAKQFNTHHRSIGFLVQRELTALEQLQKNPDRPYVAIVGGAKVHDKVAFIQKLLPKVDALLLAPAMVSTFELARGKRVGKSLVDEKSIEICREIINEAEQQNVPLIFPVDYQITQETLNGALSIVPADTVPSTAIISSIGPKTIKLYEQALLNAHTIFFSGIFGFIERKDTMEGAKKLIEIIAQSGAKSYIAGGDTVAATQALGLIDQIDYVSTGGGAALAYISGQDLPGLKALQDEMPHHRSS